MRYSSSMRWSVGALIATALLAGVVVSLPAGSVPSKWLPWKTQGENMPSVETSARVQHVNTADFNQKVLQSQTPVLVDFYAEWCPPCRALGPVLEEVAGEISHAKIVKVNVDDNPQLANRYRIESIPNLLVFQDGRIIGQHRGLASKAALKQLLQE
jgi:thioredoxin 1